MTLLNLGSYDIDSRHNKVTNRFTHISKKLHSKKVQKELAKLMIERYGK